MTLTKLEIGDWESKCMSRKQTVRRRQNPYDKKRAGCWQWGLGFVLLFLVTMVCLLAGFVVYAQTQQANSGIRLDGGDPNLNPVQRVVLQGRLANQAEQLQQAAGNGDTAVSFTINSGESANVIADNLLQAGLLNDRQLFLDYARFYGLDSQLEAGDFRLSPQLTIPEMAVALTDARPLDFTVSFLPGWRLEEMANSIAVLQPGNIKADEFLAIAQRHTPFDTSRYDFLTDLPADASLEGYLYPDAYTLPLEATAVTLVEAMLNNFGQQVTPQLRQAVAEQGLSLREGLIIASITHREALLAEERPLIAGVYLNRLRIEMLLQADPTVQYAVGYQAASERWWKNPLTLDDLQFDSPYNTYLYAGLPPGPIANVGVATLQAVANPTPSDYFFFVADCDAAVAGTHYFSVNFEAHLAKVQSCQ